MRKRKRFRKLGVRVVLGMFGYRPVVYMPKVSGFTKIVSDVLMVSFD